MLKLDEEWSCRKYGLSCCILTRTGRVTSTKPYRHRAAHHGLVLKICSLKQSTSYNPSTFRRTEQEDCCDFETNPNYSNSEASQELCGKLSSKTKTKKQTNKTDSQFATLEFQTLSVAPQALTGSEPTGYHSLFCSKPLQMLCLTTMGCFPRLFSQKTLIFKTSPFPAFSRS